VTSAARDRSPASWARAADTAAFACATWTFNGARLSTARVSPASTVSPSATLTEMTVPEIFGKTPTSLVATTLPEALTVTDRVFVEAVAVVTDVVRVITE